MITVAVRALAAVGVKVRLRTQLAPAASVAPLMQVVPEASAKSPALAPPSTAVAMLRGAVPLLVRVTVCTGLGARSEGRRGGKEGGARGAAGGVIGEAGGTRGCRSGVSSRGAEEEGAT